QIALERAFHGVEPVGVVHIDLVGADRSERHIAAKTRKPGTGSQIEADGLALKREERCVAATVGQGRPRGGVGCSRRGWSRGSLRVFSVARLLQAGHECHHGGIHGVSVSCAEWIPCHRHRPSPCAHPMRSRWAARRGFIRM
ncbi:MAG: hypothetical protein ACK56F_06600, partial [bacterium]